MESTLEKNFNILIADENQQFKTTLASRLRLVGFKVDFAEGGFHLLHTLEHERKHQLLILHENMHDMSAEEIVLLVRNYKNKTELPILFISKTRTKNEIYSLISDGVNEFIVKSPNLQPIIERAQKYFAQIKDS
jgi:DNA-binding response OmpR family regulator